MTMSKFDSVIGCVELPETDPELTLWAMEHKKYGDHVLTCLHNMWSKIPGREPGIRSYYAVAGEIVNESTLHLMYTFPHAIRICPFLDDHKRERYAIYCANVHLASILAELDLVSAHKNYEILKWITNNVKFK